MHYLLFYEVGEDYVSRRVPFRQAHLENAWRASERGELVLGGAFANAADGAALLFRGDSPEVAERFARADPYVVNGVVKRWTVREWTTVAGDAAATPIRPESAAASGATRTGVSDREANRPILRMWKGRSTPERAGEYVRHAVSKVFPALHAVAGHRGAYLLRRSVNGAVEFVVLTLWDSMEAVRRLAGQDAEKAVVDPEARAALASFDDRVTHFEVVHKTEGPAR